MDYYNLALQHIDLVQPTIVRMELLKPVGGFKQGYHTYLPPATYIVNIPHNYNLTEVTSIALANDPNITILGIYQ